MRWDGVDAFLAVVEAGGFTAAGARLGVSTSHVSRQIAQLEARLGVKLLARLTRSIRLTDAGAEYYARMAMLAEMIDESDQTTSGGQGALSGLIRVSAAGSFAETAVARSLARFAAAHPGVSVEMSFDATLLNLSEAGFDFVVRYGIEPSGEGVVRRLARRPMACVAAPSYLAAAGEPETPQALATHACLRSPIASWRFVDPKSGERITVRPSGPWRADSSTAIVEAATAGLGIAYLSACNFTGRLASGALRRILVGWEDPEPASWILYPDRRFLPRRVRLAIDHLVAELGD